LYNGIRSLVSKGSRVGPLSNSVALPPLPTTETLTLKLFRRERAISTFDYTFNPPHRSSPSFSTLVGSDLHAVLPALHPAHGSITWFRVYRQQLYALFRLGFPSAPPQNGLTLLLTISRRIIMQKARRHPGETLLRASPRRAPTACRHVVSGSRSSPCRGSSHLSLALLRSLSVASEYLALRDGPRRFEPAFTCPALLRCQTGGPCFSRTGLSPSLVVLP
jgi:hypothetical protein